MNHVKWSGVNLMLMVAVRWKRFFSFEGIAAGSLSIIFLGNDEFCHYVSMGRAVQAVNAAEHFCTSGDIVVSPTAWCHVSQLPIVKTVLDDKKHLLVSMGENRWVSASKT